MSHWQSEEELAGGRWVGNVLFQGPLGSNLGFPGGSDGKESACSGGDLGSIPGLGRSSGEGYDYPLQYSCLENPMDRGAWRVTVHGITKSKIWLSDYTLTFQGPIPEEFMLGAGEVMSSEDEVWQKTGERSGQPHSWWRGEVCRQVCSSRFEPLGSGSLWDALTFCCQWSPFSGTHFF